MIRIPHLSLYSIFTNSAIVTCLLVLFNILYLPLERDAISIVKVMVMGVCPLVFILKGPIVSKALLLGISYWLLVYFLSAFKGEMRFSTIGFLGMYLCMFITYYDLILKGAFSLTHFQKVLKCLIVAYGVVLIAQQMCLMVGIRNLPLINLQGQFYLSISKLPSLSLEPSHSARILSVAMLGYLRCIEITKHRKPLVKELFSKEHIWVSVLFLWCIFTMGSGTAFVGIAILSLYFITRKSAIYIVPILITLFILGQSMEIKQLNRAVALAGATMNGSVEEMNEADGSGASRFIPVVNFLTKTDLTKVETWIGKKSMAKDKLWWTRMDRSIIDQYGLIAFVLSMVLVYSCMIRRFFSIETLMFCLLLGFAIGNIYYSWGCLMIMTGVRYFQEKYEE